MSEKLFIGTSGWNYKHWRNSIYPEKFAARKWLAYMTERFNTVELNTSYYAIPTENAVRTWDTTVPHGFRFAAKLWRGITHYRKLKNSTDFIVRYLDVINCISKPHRGPILVQLPPNQGKDLAKLSDFVDDWRATDPEHWKLAFEFRNNDWLSPDTYKLLDRKHVALCIHDMHGKAAVDEPNDTPLIYLRRHGGGERHYEGSYSPAQIAHDAAHIRTWLGEGRTVYVYYNNDIGGHAYYNAIDLRAAIGQI
jgi:uncharacterized protein YecE (DUF72 family)